MKVREYFDKKAVQYHDSRSRGLLGYLVRKEKSVIMRMMDVKNGEKILDFGCGSGFYSELIKNAGGDVIGVDFSEAMINVLRRHGVSGVVGDVQSINLGKEFDKALSAGVIEFVDARKLIWNLGKHLKREGFAVILYPRLSVGGLMYKIFHLCHGINITVFSFWDIKRLLKEGGFDVVDYSVASFTSAAIKIKLRTK